MKKIMYFFVFLLSSCWDRNSTFKVVPLGTNIDTFEISHEFHTLCDHGAGDTAFIAFDVMKDSVMRVSFYKQDTIKDFVVISGSSGSDPSEKLLKVRWIKGLVIEVE